MISQPRPLSEDDAVKILSLYWFFSWLGFKQSSLRPSCLFFHWMIPTGLYSRLASLFNFATVQTGHLTFTPQGAPSAKSYRNRKQQLLMDRLQTSSKDPLSLLVPEPQCEKQQNGFELFINMSLETEQNMSSSVQMSPPDLYFIRVQYLMFHLLSIFFSFSVLSPTISSALFHPKLTHLIIDLLM